MRWRDRAERRLFKRIRDLAEVKRPCRLTVLRHEEDARVKEIPVAGTTVGMYRDWHSSLHDVIFRKRETELQDAYVLGHELTHAKQAESWPDFGTRYNLYNRVYGYPGNPFEVEARLRGCELAAKLFDTGPLFVTNGIDDVRPIAEWEQIDLKPKGFWKPELVVPLPDLTTKELAIALGAKVMEEIKTTW